jgi:hypothetical protein
VTPPSPGWVSDESAFAQAAAEILEARMPSGALHRAVKSAELAAVYAGTETAADDRAGRQIGARVGRQAAALARRYFAGKR